MTRPVCGPRAVAGLGAALWAVAAACVAPASEPPYAYSFEGRTMGTRYTVRVADPADPGREAELVDLVRGTLARIDASMSTYRPDSELARLNAAAAGEPVPLSAETFAVLATAVAVAGDSGGAFDPTVGGLVDAWGFGPAEVGSPPGEAELERLRSHAGTDKLLLDEATHTATKTDGQLRVDLSAIAKGYAADAVADALERAGLRAVMVEVGGEVAVRGERAEGRPWRIGIERPDGSGALWRSVPLVDRALATSGNYRNFRRVGGRVFGHTIDPRTGRPVEHRTASVSVLAHRCMLADAWATALMVMGAEQGRVWADARGIAALFLVASRDGDFVERPTAAMQKWIGGERGAGLQ